MDQQEEIERLRAENHELRGAYQQTLEELSQVREMLRLALARIEELEKQREPPECVKENVKKRPAEEKKPRKKRDAKHNRGRTRAVPTQIVEHRIITSPQCHLRLGGISLARVREVIELPEPQPGEVIHHRIGPRLVRTLSAVARGSGGSAGGRVGARAYRSPIDQLDCPGAHGHARAGEAHPCVAAHAVSLRDQQWRDRRTAAPGGEPCRASDCGDQRTDPRQPGRASG